MKKKTSQFNIAFIITAYKSAAQTNLLINQMLSYSASYVFVHIDKKSNFGAGDITRHERVTVLDQRYRVEWGDMSQAKAIVSLLKAVADSEIKSIQYISLHSEADLLVRPVQELADFLQEDQASAYIDHAKLPIDGWGHGGGLERIKLRYPKAFRQKLAKNHPLRYVRAGYQVAFEKRLIPGLRLPKDLQFYGGSDWFTVRMDTVQRSLKYLDVHPEYNDIFRYSLVGNEIYFVTLFNIVREEAADISGTNLRYIDWSTVNPLESGAPKTLTTEDIEAIESSRQFFARKFDPAVDEEVMEYFFRKIVDEVSEGKPHKKNNVAKEPLVSVIMAEYNTNPIDLETSIRSILLQDYRNLEIILVDDGGKNNLNNLSKKINDARLQIVKNSENKGLVYSLNNAIHHARGEYLVRMDTDDIALPERISIQLDFMQKHPEFVVVGSRAIEFSNDQEIGILAKAGEKTKKQIMRGDTFVHPSVMMRKSVLEAVGGYDNFQRAEDLALWCKLLLGGHRLYILKDVLLKYRVNPNDYSKRSLKYRGGEIKARLQYYPKLGAGPIEYSRILKSIVAGIMPHGFVRKYRKKFVIGGKDEK